MVGEKYRNRIKRLARSLDPERPSHGWGVPSEVVEEQFFEGSRQIGQRAWQLRAARERGEELSSPQDSGTTGIELQAHVISYAAEDGSLDSVPAELWELLEARRIQVPQTVDNAEEYREAFDRIQAAGLSLALEEYLQIGEARHG